jgi:hypothetical protein
LSRKIEDPQMERHLHGTVSIRIHIGNDIHVYVSVARPTSIGASEARKQIVNAADRE